MITPRDRAFCAQALARGWLTAEQAEELVRLAEGINQAFTVPLDLGTVARARGYLTAEQVESLARAVAPGAYDATVTSDHAAAAPQTASRTTPAPADATPAGPGSTQAAPGAGPAASAAAPPPVPAGVKLVLGEYEVMREVGRGGMGVVYEALQRPLGRRVALKVLLAADGDPEGLERFRREAAAVAKLNHPGIVKVYGAGNASGSNYYAMEFVEGRGLDKVVAEGGALDPARAARIGVAVGEALGYAHGQGILHRDIKPGNILITADERVMVADFGLARDAAVSALTASAQMLGTPRYMSPEQADGIRAEIDYRSDQYSLGATLYELVAGEPAFCEDNLAALVHKVLFVEPRPVRAVRPSVPLDLERIIAKAMDKEKGRRYPGMGEMVADLERFLRGDAVSARPPGVASRVMRRLRRHRRLSAVAAGVAVGLVVLGGMWWLERREGRARAQVIGVAARHVQEGSAADAVRVLTEYLVSHPAHASVLLERGRARVEVGDAAGAEADLDEAVRLDGGLVPARVERGRVRLARGDVGGAMADLEAALVAEPGRGDALVYRAQAKLRKGLGQEAEADCGLALERVGAGDVRALAFAVRGEAKAAGGEARVAGEEGVGGAGGGVGVGGRAEEAMRDAEAALAESPDLREGLLLHARLLGERLDDAGAEKEYDKLLVRNKADVEALKGRAWARWMQAKEPGATADAEEWMRLRPKECGGRMLLARVMCGRGAQGAIEAREVLDDSRDDLGGSGEECLLRARLRLLSGDFEGARKRLLAASATQEHGIEALEEIARVNLICIAVMRAGGYPPQATARLRDEALDFAKRAARSIPLRPSALLILGRVLQESGDAQGAEDAWRRGTAVLATDASEGSGLYRRAYRCYTKLQAQLAADDGQDKLGGLLAPVDRLCALGTIESPWDPRPHALMGWRRHLCGEWQRAVKAFAASLELDPLLFDAQLGLGILLRDAPQIQDPAESITHLDAACKIDPNNGRALLERAIARKAGGDLPGAIQDIQQAERAGTTCAILWRLKSDLAHASEGVPGADGMERRWRDTPGDADFSFFYYTIGRHAMRNKERPVAFEMFTRAINEDPKNWRAYQQRAGMLFQGARVRAALNDYARACELNPACTARVISKYYAHKANPLIVLAAQTDSLSPKEPADLLATGMIEWARGSNTTALDHLRQATESNRGFFTAWVMRAMVELSIADRESAQRSVDAARSLDPEGPVIYYLRAWLAAAQGNIKEGTRCAEQALSGFDRNNAMWREPGLKVLEASPEYRALFNRK